MQGFFNTLLSADADSVCGAAYGTRDEARTNGRNGLEVLTKSRLVLLTTETTKEDTASAR